MDPHKAALYERSHLDLHCLQFQLFSVWCFNPIALRKAKIVSESNRVMSQSVTQEESLNLSKQETWTM